MDTFIFSKCCYDKKKVVVWVHINKLPVELYNENFLSREGSILGTMLKTDKTTSFHSRGKYAIICVELDLDKPLLSHISARGMNLCLEYGGLHSICFGCDKYGHKKDNCKELLEMEEEASPVGVNQQVESTQVVHMYTSTMEELAMQQKNLVQKK